MTGMTKAGFKKKFLWIYGISVLGGGTALCIFANQTAFVKGLFLYGIVVFYGFIPCVLLALIVEFFTTD